ncbi:MAG: MFS transporter, partial [Actinobacteria bacterium]|nr:MFS transporter [Actinomycetota bacterium]
NSVSSNVLIANYSPVTHRGRFNAIIYFVNGAGFAMGPLLMGLYIKFNGIKNVWTLIFIMALFAALLMLILFLLEKRKIVKGES